MAENGVGFNRVKLEWSLRGLRSTLEDIADREEMHFALSIGNSTLGDRVMGGRSVEQAEVYVDRKEKDTKLERMKAESYALIEGINSLPSKQREVFWKRYVEGYLPDETCIELNISLATYKRRHSQGFKKLLERLS